MENTTTTTKATLETETCTRCGGSGKYSRCQSYGDTCFRCAGKGTTLSARGAAASRYLRALRSKRADEVRVGDVMEFTGITVGGAVFRHFATVTEVGTYAQRFATTRDAAGEPIWQERTLVDIKAAASKYGPTSAAYEPDDLRRVKQSPEDAARTFALALEYQDSLTKTGKPRKRP